MNFDIIEILNTYGLPTALAGLFIWFYKQSADKYNSFLKEAIKTENKRADKSDQIIKEIRDLKVSTEEATIKLAELQRTIMAYLLKERE